MVYENTTFIGGAPTWANACVGENGLPGYWEYAKGYSQAAVILIDIVLQERGLKHSVDELVYPVCFNMRHSVELRLKGAISELILIENLRGGTFNFDLIGSHDIGNLWGVLVERSRIIDDRYEPIIARLVQKISDFAEIDATGQTFRYPLNTESQKHLVDIKIINFVELKRSFSVLEKTLDELHYLNKYLRDEYEYCTFTKTLSRKNLFELATMLPIRSTWRDQSFSSIKSEIKERFKIGSKELSDSIKRIEAHFELAPQIGMSVPLLGIVEVDIDEFFHHWFKQHDVPSDSDSLELEVCELGTDVMFQEFVKDMEIQAKVWEVVLPKLTADKLAGLHALFYFGLDLDFSEKYQHIFEIERRRAMEAYADSENSVKLLFFHIFNKTNAVYNILRSLYFLRKSELADRLVTKYSLDKKFSWLDEARNLDLFRKPECCGYT
jgi:hypothetical protein